MNDLNDDCYKEESLDNDERDDNRARAPNGMPHGRIASCVSQTVSRERSSGETVSVS
jgi:hypothetical protein